MHKGVALGDGTILHNTPFRGEHVTSEQEFRAGKRMYIERLDEDERRRALSRLRSGRERSYNLLTNNCEHTVTRATEGKARSPQLQSWVVGTTLAVAAFALTRHPVVTAAAYAAGRKWAGKVR